MAGPECTTDLWMTATFEKFKTWQLKLSLVLSKVMLFAFTQVVKKKKKSKELSKIHSVPLKATGRVC